MGKSIELTKHSKERFEQRTDFNATTQHQNANKAFRSGYEFSRFIDPVYSFLKSHCSNGGRYVAKIFNDYVYIFENNVKHKLLTVYKVPEKYLPINNYLINTDDLSSCIIALVHKETDEIKYWGTHNTFADNLDEILEFKSRIRAENYIYNNSELKKLKKEYTIELV